MAVLCSHARHHVYRSVGVIPLIIHSQGSCVTFRVCLQDDVRVQKMTKRMKMLEEVNNNVKLLSEMLSHYDKDRSSESDRELIRVRCNPYSVELTMHSVIIQRILYTFKNKTIINHNVDHY